MGIAQMGIETLIINVFLYLVIILPSKLRMPNAGMGIGGNVNKFILTGVSRNVFMYY